VTVSSDALAGRVSEQGTTLVAFLGSSCPISERLTELLAELGAVEGEQLTIVNVDAEPLLAQTFGVRVLPTFAVFVDGQLSVVRTGALGRGNREAMLGRGQLTARRGMRRRR
jgi:thioredoxin 1